MSDSASDYSIRPLTVDDWQKFKAIRLEGLQKYPQCFGSTYAKEANYTENDWRGFISGKDGRYFLLMHDDKVIGTTGIITADEDPESAVMIASYITPEHQGKRLSAKLYEARINAAAVNLKWKKILVFHRDGNESSRRANQKWGFRFTGIVPQEWPDGMTVDKYCYELELENIRQNDQPKLKKT